MEEVTGKEAARRFFNSLAGDPQAAEFEKLHSPSDFIALAVRLGRERGFEFTSEDVEALLKETAGSDAPMSVAEPDTVSAGWIARTLVNCPDSGWAGGSVPKTAAVNCYCLPGPGPTLPGGLW